MIQFDVSVHLFKFIFVLFTENREDMLNPANNKLTDVLEEANKLFVNGIISIQCYFLFN